MVVSPGRTTSRKDVKTSYTMSPARCIFSSSSRLRKVIAISFLAHQESVNSARPAHNVEHLPLHFVDAFRGIHLVQASQPAVICNQRLGLHFVSMQPGPDNFFAIIWPLLQFAAI